VAYALRRCLEMVSDETRKKLTSNKSLKENIMDNVITDMEKEVSREDLKELYVSREDLEKLYDVITKFGLEELEKWEDDFLGMVILVSKEGRAVYAPLNEEEDIALLDKFLKSGRVSAIINTNKGWVTRPNEDGPKSLSLRAFRKRCDETFIAAIESAEVKMTKKWKIKRDKEGKMIFPLGKPEVLSGNDAPIVRLVKNSRNFIRIGI